MLLSSLRVEAMVLGVLLLVACLGVEAKPHEEIAIREGLLCDDLRNSCLGDDPGDNSRDIRDYPEELSCEDYSDFGYFCVAAYQCSENFTIITSGAGLLDSRSAGDSERVLPDREEVLLSKCPEAIDGCCQLPEAFNAFSRPSKSQVKEAGDCDPVFGTCDGTRDSDSGEVYSPNIRRCGVRNGGGTVDDLQRAIVGEADFGEWPHVCAILRLESLASQGGPVKIYECGASLLDDGVLLTAAHCVKRLEAEDLVVRCGEWNTQSEEERLPFQERRVRELRRHPQFRASEHYYNFALVFLEEEFERAEHIQPTCLPGPCSGAEGGQVCVAGGYGKDTFGQEGRYATIQKEVVVPIVKNGRCQDLLRQTRLGEYFKLHSSFICAGGEGEADTCVGDGGSPLTCRLPGRREWFQLGMVSWGIGCGGESPGVYASVAKASCWIDQQVSEYYQEAPGSRLGLQGECRGSKATQC